MKNNRDIALFIVLVFAFLVVGCSGNNTDNNVRGAEPGDAKIGENSLLPGDSTGSSLELREDFDLGNLSGAESLKEIFSAGEAVYRMGQIMDALGSFRLLTEKAEGKIPPDEMGSVGNTGWEIQYLGFHNWTNTVLGTLLLQDYQIKKLECELAGERLGAGKIEQKEWEEKEDEYLTAKNKFQQFLDSYSIAD